MSTLPKSLRRIVARAESRFGDSKTADGTLKRANYLRRVTSYMRGDEGPVGVRYVSTRRPKTLLQKMRAKVKGLSLRQLLRDIRRIEEEWTQLAFEMRRWGSEGKEPQAFPARRRAAEIQVITFCLIAEARARGVTGIKDPEYFNPLEVA